MAGAVPPDAVVLTTARVDGRKLDDVVRARAFTLSGSMGAASKARIKVARPLESCDPMAIQAQPPSANGSTEGGTPPPLMAREESHREPAHSASRGHQLRQLAVTP
jgi:hypothetical protein